MADVNSSLFSIRPATPEDLNQVVEIEKNVHRSPWTLEHFRAEFDKPYSQFLLLTDDETDTQIAAYLVYWQMHDEFEILNIAVDLPYRGLGYAKTMIRKIIFLADREKIHLIKLDVRKGNTAAVQLYQSLNFSITHVRKKFYSDGEDAYQMILKMNEVVLPY